MSNKRNISYRRYFFLIFGLAVLLGLISLIKNNNVVYADWYVDGNGELIYIPAESNVLGIVYAKEGGSGGSGTSLKPQSVKPTEQPQALEIERVEDETENETEDKVETKTGEEATIKTRRKKTELRTDVFANGIKVRIEQKEGRLIIKGETEEGDEIILGEQELFKIEERLDKNTIKIATGSGNSFIFARGTIGAQSNFPLSVDLATNALSVNTPAGVKVVTVLPDAAVQNMLAANVISRLSTETITGATPSAALKGVGDIVQFELRSGVPVYEIAGLSNQKLLGFIPVVIPTKAVVSAETGALVTKETSPLNTLLDLVSF